MKPQATGCAEGLIVQVPHIDKSLELNFESSKVCGDSFNSDLKT